MRAYGGSGCIDPRFLDLGISWGWVVWFTPQPLYSPGERDPCTYWIGSWVGPRPGLDDVEKRKFLTLQGLELRPLGRPARSQSLQQFEKKNTKNISQIQSRKILHDYVTNKYEIIFWIIFVKERVNTSDKASDPSISNIRFVSRQEQFFYLNWVPLTNAELINFCRPWSFPFLPNSFQFAVRIHPVIYCNGV
jgi:hypothetical protein